MKYFCIFWWQYCWLLLFSKNRKTCVDRLYQLEKVHVHNCVEGKLVMMCLGVRMLLLCLCDCMHAYTDRNHASTLYLYQSNSCTGKNVECVLFEFFCCCCFRLGWYLAFHHCFFYCASSCCLSWLLSSLVCVWFDVLCTCLCNTLSMIFEVMINNSVQVHYTYLILTCPGLCINHLWRGMRWVCIPFSAFLLDLWLSLWKCTV